MTTTIKAVFSNQLVFPKGSCTDIYLASQTGFQFTRPCNTTVQTSESTVDDTALHNHPTFGCMRSDGLIPSGLVIQHRVRSLLTTSGVAGSRRILLGAGTWTTSTGTQLTLSPSESPVVNPPGITGTGVGGTFLHHTSGGNSVFFDHGADTGTRFTYSFWVKPKTNLQTNLINQATNAFTFFNMAPSNEWSRAVIAKGTASRRYWNPIECRAWTGGAAAQSRQAYVDLAQVEQGDFPTEVTGDMGANTKREPDILFWPTGSQILTSSSQVHFRAIFTPRFSSAMQVFNCNSGTTVAAQTYYYLCSWGTTGQNAIRIKDSDHKLYVKFNNTGEVTSSVAMAWSQYDLVEIEVKAGANIASIARYRVNNGSWTDLTLGTVAQTPAPTGAVGIMTDINASTGDVNETFTCWLHEVEFVGTTAGVTPVEPTRESECMGPGLYEDSSTTLNTLVLRPSKPGRAIIRVEKSQATPTKGPYPDD